MRRYSKIYHSFIWNGYATYFILTLSIRSRYTMSTPMSASINVGFDIVVAVVIGVILVVTVLLDT